MKLFVYLGVLCLAIFTKTLSQTPNYQWAKSAGGANDEGGYSCVTDASGNIIVVGEYASSSITFGTNTLTNAAAGTADILIVKYDANGNVLWIRSAGGINRDGAYGCSVDASGNIIITGYFASPSITFGSFTLTNISASFDAFVAKYDPNGNVLWAKSIGGSGSEKGQSCTVDPAANIFITGWFSSSNLTLGTNTLTNINSGTFDVFIAKYDPSGNVLWAKRTGGTSPDNGYSCSADINGNVFTTGYFTSSNITLGTTTLTNSSAGTADIFIAKYDPNGNILWAKGAGSTSADFGLSCSVDMTGNVITTGYFMSSSIIFGATTLTGTTSQNFYIVKHDSNGNLLWARSAFGSGYGNSCTIDSGGNIFVTGVFGGSLGLGTTTLTSAGMDDLFILKYDPNGNVVWAKGAGGTGIESSSSINVDTSGNVVATGYFTSSSIALGSTTLTNAGPSGVSDFYVFKLGGLTGIEEINGSYNSINSFPNPATNILNIENTSNIKIDAIIVLDITGRKVLEQKENTSQINIETLEQGMYQLQITSEGKNYSSKFIKE